jgi:hypothetical protein
MFRSLVLDAFIRPFGNPDVSSVMAQKFLFSNCIL